MNPHPPPAVVVRMSCPGASSMRSFAPRRTLCGYRDNPHRALCGYRNNHGVRSGEARIAGVGIDCGHDCDSLGECAVEEPLQKHVGRSAQTEVQHLRLMAQGVLYGLGQREAAAHGCAADLDLPAGAQRHQCGVGRHSDDADAVVALRGDHAGNRGPMRFGGLAAAAHEVLRVGKLSHKVGVPHVDAAVDLRDTDVTTGGDGVHLVEPQRLRRGLQRIVTVVARQRAVQMHGLRPFHARISPQLLEHCFGRCIRRHADHEAM